MNKTITVVTVTFNAGSLLEETIKSVVSQSYNDYEYIIIDGGSTDGTLEIINRYSDSVSYFESKADNGIYHAMNKAIDKSTGAWVNFMNAGDVFVDNNVLEKIRLDLDDEYDFIYGDRYRVNGAGDRKLECAGSIEETLHREVVFHQALFTKLEVLKKNHYSTCYKLASDYEYVVRAYVNGMKFKKIPYVICEFLEGGRSREQFLLAQIEASKIVAENCSDNKILKNNMYFENLIKVNIGYILNKYVQAEKNNNKNFLINVTRHPIGMKILSANNASKEIRDLLDRINEPLSKAIGRSEPSFIWWWRMLFSRSMMRIKYLLKNNMLFRLGENKNIRDKTNIVNTNDYKNIKPVEDVTKGCKITIVTVTLNAESLIERTLKSVAMQTYQNIEYIVIDGGSVDATNKIIDLYKDVISKHIIEKDNGLYFAMNKGVKNASGDYVLFLNAGDTLAEDTTISALLMKNRMIDDVIYGDRYYVHDGERELQKAKEMSTIFHRMPFCHQSCFVKRSVLLNYEFNTTYKFAADYELIVRLYNNNASFRYVDFPICNYESGGLSESGIRPYVEVIKILFDNCNDKDVIKNSVYFRGFKNNFTDLIDF